MPRKFLKSISPKPEKFFGTTLNAVFGDTLHSHWLWHLHRNTASTAIFVGVFCAFLPIPGQMLVAAGLAILLRCHLPIATLTVWITNPLTVAPIFYGCYSLGCFLLQQTPLTISGPDSITIQLLLKEAGTIWQPLLLGSVIAGLFFGSIGYGVVRVAWRFSVAKRWLNRHKNH